MEFRFALAHILFLSTSTVYLAASVLFVLYLAGSDKFQRLGAIAPHLVAVGAALHAADITVSSFVYNVCPVKGIHFGMSVISMLVCATYAVVRSRFRINIVGAFIAPLALTFLLASRFGSLTEDPATRIKSAVLPFHVASVLLGAVLFTLAFGAAVAYLVQEQRLKAKKVQGVFLRLPPLDALDRAEHRFLLAGFPLLTIGIVTGTLWARGVEVGTPGEITRAVFGYVSWLLFALVLLLRAAAGWRGRRAAYGTIAGFGFTVLVLVLYLVRSPGVGPS